MGGSDSDAGLHSRAVLAWQEGAVGVTERIIIAVQRQRDNATLTVSMDGRVLGDVLEWGPGDWRIVRPPVPYPTLEAAIAALLRERGE